MITLNQIQEKIAQAIKNSSLTQTELGNKIGIGQQTISEYVHGIRKLIVDNYIILYVPNHDKKEIIVYRVIYGAQNYINAI